MLGNIFKKKPLALRIGDTAPDFKAETTTGDISFHEWIGSSYAMIFSHPKDFTPVCSTELSRTAALKPEFDKRNCKIIGLSVDSVSEHSSWESDIADVCYSCTEYYEPESEVGINWNDKDIGIEWPVSCPNLSKKDAAAKSFQDLLK